MAPHLSWTTSPRIFAACRIAVVLVVAAASVRCGPGASPPPAATATAPAPAAAAPSAGPASTEVRPRVVAITPATVRVVDGRANQSFEVEYTITNPEQVKSAELRINAPGAGRVTRQAVEVAASGRGTVSIDDRFDLGPTVRLRAVCDAGVTDWFTVGTPAATDRPVGPAPAIQNVYPTSVSLGDAYARAKGQLDDNSGVVVKMRGAFTRDCRPEATINGRPQALSNTGADLKELELFLRYADLDMRSVASRYLEVSLAITGPSIGATNIARVPFVE